MTTYHMTSQRVLHAKAPWEDHGSDRAYHDEPHANDSRSVYSGVPHITQSVGVCKTHHPVNLPQKLVNGWCEACLANWAMQE